MDIRKTPTAPASPWQDGYAERLIGLIRRVRVWVFDTLNFISAQGMLLSSRMGAEGNVRSALDGTLPAGVNRRRRFALADETATQTKPCDNERKSPHRDPRKNDSSTRPWQQIMVNPHLIGQ